MSKLILHSPLPLMQCNSGYYNCSLGVILENYFGYVWPNTPLWGDFLGVHFYFLRTCLLPQWTGHNITEPLCLSTSHFQTFHCPGYYLYLRGGYSLFQYIPMVWHSYTTNIYLYSLYLWLSPPATQNIWVRLPFQSIFHSHIWLFIQIIWGRFTYIKIRDNSIKSDQDEEILRSEKNEVIWLCALCNQVFITVINYCKICGTTD